MYVVASQGNFSYVDPTSTADGTEGALAQNHISSDTLRIRALIAFVIKSRLLSELEVPREHIVRSFHVD